MKFSNLVTYANNIYKSCCKEIGKNKSAWCAIGFTTAIASLVLPELIVGVGAIVISVAVLGNSIYNVYKESIVLEEDHGYTAIDKISDDSTKQKVEVSAVDTNNNLSKEEVDLNLLGCAETASAA